MANSKGDATTTAADTKNAAPSPTPTANSNNNGNSNSNNSNNNNNNNNNDPATTQNQNPSPTNNNNNNNNPPKATQPASTPTNNDNTNKPATNSIGPTVIVTTSYSTYLPSQSSLSFSSIASSIPGGNATANTNGTISSNDSSEGGGGATAGEMIGGMLGATLLIVVFITMIVRKKINVLRSAKRTSYRLRDTEFNDLYAVGQPAYFDEKHGRGSVLMDPNRPDSIYIDHSVGSRVSFAPLVGQRQSIYRQSTGDIYSPPASLMPVSGRFTPPMGPQTTTYNPARYSSYANVNNYGGYNGDFDHNYDMETNNFNGNNQNGPYGDDPRLLSPPDDVHAR